MKKTISTNIFEDDYLLVINKAGGVLSIPDRFDDTLPNLYQQLKHKYPDIYVVHRIDKGTSGCILFAKTKEVHRALSLAFQNRTIEKHYLALVNGRIKEAGSIDLKLEEKGKKMHVSKQGKKAFSEYQRIELFKNYSLIDVSIQTGRMHQIRVHLNAIGHPLLVDSKYGVRSEIFVSEIKGRSYRRSKDKIERPLMNRVSLHASSLSFKHPVTKEQMSLKAELPKDFRAVLNQLRKHCAVVN